MYCLKYLMSMFACWQFYFLQEPPWSASLLGPPCPWPAYQDYWQAWKDRWCLQEAISYIYQSWPYYCVGSCPNSLDEAFLFRQFPEMMFCPRKIMQLWNLNILYRTMCFLQPLRVIWFWWDSCGLTLYILLLSEWSFPPVVHTLCASLNAVPMLYPFSTLKKC